MLHDPTQDAKLLAMLRNDRGIALPLALLALVLVSILIAGGLITSTTEAATGAAHRAGVTSLYQAEAATDWYVAEHGGRPLVPGVYQITLDAANGTSSDLEVTVASLTDIREADQRIFVASVGARSATGSGREVVQLIRQTVDIAPLHTEVQSGLTLGGALNISGNAFTISGYDACGEGDDLMGVHRADGAEITANHENHYDNFVGVDADGNEVSGKDAWLDSELSSLDLARQALGMEDAETIHDIVDRLPSYLKYGERFVDEGGQPLAKFDGYTGKESVTVVDAEGGHVRLRGGSGIIIIVNGSLEMSGNDRFDGIVVVEGRFRLSGTPEIRGALISLGEIHTDEENVIDLDESAIGQGHVTVRYDSCAVGLAERAFADAMAEGGLARTERPLGWFEVVR
jgi:hypothetical protein